MCYLAYSENSRELLAVNGMHMYRYDQGSKLDAANQVPMTPKGRKARRQIYDYI